jgi:hypothetical protein
MSATESESTVRACIFCGARPVTDEHAWPQWIAKYLPKTKNILYNVTETRGDAAPTIQERGNRYPFTTKVGCVCEACNTGWMHELEMSAELILAPLIEGRPTNRKGNPWALREWRQSIAATWATKTALVLQEMSTEQAIAREFGQPFRRQLRPHNFAQVWIAHYAGEQAHSFYQGSLHMVDKSRPGEPVVMTAYTATIAVGHVAFRLFGHWVKDGPICVPTGDVARSLAQIHPLTPVAQWPPPLSIDDDGLHAITLAIQHELELRGQHIEAG